MPNLIEVQKSSYDHFLQMRRAAPKRAATSACRRSSSRSSRSATSPTAPQLEFVQVRARGAEVRRRGVPAARHDLRRAAEGDPAPGRLGRRRGDRRALDPRHQGAGRLHGRHAADDEQRHLHHQRHRARHRQPDAPLARASSSTTTRARPIPRASISSPPGSSPIAAPGSTSSSTPRTSSTSASTGAASCRRRRCCSPSGARRRRRSARARRGRQDAARVEARHVAGGDPRLSTRRSPSPAARRAGRRLRSDALRGAKLDRRPDRRQDRQGHGRGRHQADAAPGARSCEERAQGGLSSAPRIWSAATSPATSSTRRPARSSSRPATS